MVDRLVVAEYDRSGRAGVESTVDVPDWPLIEEHIKRLDRFRYPYVQLLGEAGGVGSELTILGGNGKFHICLQDQCGQRIPRDGTKTEILVEVWKSDQGFEARDTELVDRLADVLAIARHYYAEGSAHPDFAWMP